jgi:hypothetical protein
MRKRVLDGCSSYGVDGRVRISNFKFEISNKFHRCFLISLLGTPCADLLLECNSLLNFLEVRGVILPLRRAYGPL